MEAGFEHKSQVPKLMQLPSSHHNQGSYSNETDVLGVCFVKSL